MKNSIKLIPEAFFDIIAYFLPGCFLLILLLLGETFSFHQIPKDVNNFKEILFVLTAGYICGHILTALSTLIIVQPLDFLFGNPIHTLIGINVGIFNKYRHKLSDDLISGISFFIQKKFKSKIDKHTFFLCENYIRTNYPEIGFLIRKRHAFEHLHRNLVISYFILFFTMKTGVFDNLLILVSITVTSIIRYLDYRITWPKVVYENIYLLNIDDSHLKVN